MFSRSKQGAVDVISGTVPLEEESSEDLLRLAEECMTQGQPRLVIDLSRVAFIDSRGLETLLDIRDRYATEGGECKLAGPNRLCRDVLDVTGVAAEFEIASEVLEAAGSFVL